MKAWAGSIEEPVQIAIMESGFDWKWLIAGVLVPIALLAWQRWKK